MWTQFDGLDSTSCKVYYILRVYSIIRLIEDILYLYIFGLINYELADLQVSEKQKKKRKNIILPPKNPYLVTHLWYNIADASEN